MTSKREIQTWLKRKYGRNSGVLENPRALTAFARMQKKSERAQESLRLETIKAELSAIKVNPLESLVKAARFAVDVAAGEPSLSELAAATALAERYLELRNDKRSIETKLRDEEGVLLRRRYSAYRDTGGMLPFRYILARADTLDELYEALTRSDPKPAASTANSGLAVTAC